jgi:hypothetical protein
MRKIQLVLVGVSVFSLLLSFGLPNKVSTKAEVDECGGMSESWIGTFDSNWESDFQIQNKGVFYPQNRFAETKDGKAALRSDFPQGSYAVNEENVPVGGTGFRAGVLEGSDEACLSYDVQFEDGFEFNQGGKLPGFFGGDAPTGGRIPNGSDGFTSRFMWRSGGRGEVYAYIPSSIEHGTSFGRGSWSFATGRWQRISQYLKLNTPGQADGQFKVWLDGNLVYEVSNVELRTVDSLKINGFLVHTFFGGNDQSWASPKDQSIWFSDFSVKTGSLNLPQLQSSQSSSNVSNIISSASSLSSSIQQSSAQISSSSSSESTSSASVSQTLQQPTPASQTNANIKSLDRILIEIFVDKECVDMRELSQEKIQECNSKVQKIEKIIEVLTFGLVRI